MGSNYTDTDIKMLLNEINILKLEVSRLELKKSSIELDLIAKLKAKDILANQCRDYYEIEVEVRNILNKFVDSLLKD